jgi:16S rRNA (adenine1518-N6/adenine1519-N6)-dimethyltransferase
MNHRARKRFGQNFLTDRQVVQQIVDVIDPRPEDLLVEIGPGQAALTGELLASGAELHLVEIDRDLAALLEKKISGWLSESTGKLPVELHVADALKFDFKELSAGRPMRLIGNLPYNISTPLIFHLLQWPELIRDMHFMLQKEVVNRMAACPGGKTWGKLSVMCQYHCQVSPLFSVSPQAFSPRPKVDSGFVRLVPHATPPVRIRSMESLNRIVSLAFGQRRKTLRNSLRGCLQATDIEAAGIDPGLRPEMVNLKQFATLSELI